MTRLLTVVLLLAMPISGCDDLNGGADQPCFQNLTCTGSLVCIVWQKGSSKKSVCAAPQEITIGAFDLVQVVEPKCPEYKCSAPPALHCPQLHCPSPPVCPPLPECPKAPEGPCPECKPCEPGWKRPK